MPRSTATDEYIAKSEPYAQVILTKIRELVHSVSPDISETMKWSFPHFEKEGVLLSMSAFKKHCAVVFWKAPILPDPHGVLQETGKTTSMGHLGAIRSIDDLPADDVFLQLIRDAIRLNETGVRVEKKAATAKKAPPETPAIISEALALHPGAKAVYDAFSPSHKREYIEWIVDAKTDTTREKRLSQMLEWLKEGKSRNWKYQKK